MPQKLDRTITLEPGNYLTDLFGVKSGVYDIYVGDYGWDTGDLFIQTNKGRIKVRDVKEATTPTT